MSSELFLWALAGGLAVASLLGWVLFSCSFTQQRLQLRTGRGFVACRWLGAVLVVLSALLHSTGLIAACSAVLGGLLMLIGILRTPAADRASLSRLELQRFAEQAKRQHRKPQ